LIYRDHLETRAFFRNQLEIIGAFSILQTAKRSTSMQLFSSTRIYSPKWTTMEVPMGFGRGVLLWLLGIPIPIIILLALFWHN
jgi:hypothetical protein